VGDKRRTVVLGQVFVLDHGVTLQCVCVNAQAISGDSTVPPKEYAENSLSIGLLVRYRDFRMIIGSDIGGGAKYGDVESLLAPCIGKVNVLYVNHHGSAHSSNEYWLKTLRPQASIISCGADNPYSHPAKAAVDRLAAARGNHIYQTEKGTGDTSRQTIVGNNVWVRAGDKTFTVAGDSYPIDRK
jgi:beta-lactamase superfamily II metal-dependent hydrolase